ncbi:DNA-3-methyladenine glycosylase II [Lentibacillus sp. JNUCC-1]|uniref:DNA-3-methyladenine glycosylase n=1 Tax=Lentibacillus sp. JNUCC-1 TaxID=2654513 RepID=UPI0012E7702F|nr:DNA-3-methyladenine glycosylase [Lentibacillus sp. JNUCC-1]MUV38311.1 DNA-3-methyladenine glycosylase II [Lentibacillus sp. JNUCC-1]
MDLQPPFQPLPPEFYQQPTLELARSLVGHILVKDTEEGLTAGVIVETEAYLGEHDQAAHSFGKRRTKRTEIMFSEPGHVYTYTMHTHCLINVVAAEPGNPQAILIRAVEPVYGIELMQARRPVDKMKNLTNGPGKLTKAMGIEMSDYGRTFFQPPLIIAEGASVENIATGPRIGIDNSGPAKDYPYRFWIKDNPYRSR